MYIPKTFEITDTNIIIDFIESIRFGALISGNETELPLVTHLPFMLKSNQPLLLHSHIAKTNPHCNQLISENNVLLVFTGVSGYVSSSVYEKPNVPTYNYEVVHLHAKLKQILEKDKLEELSTFVNYFEAKRVNKLNVESLPKKMLLSFSKDIELFDFEVFKIEASFKMSQNRSETDLKAIIADAELNGDSKLANTIRKLN